MVNFFKTKKRCCPPTMNNAYRTNDTSSSAKKRKYHDRGVKTSRKPKRGGPGVLLTSETGREYKCQLEGLDIINHYVCAGDGSDEDENDTSLSLEEELKMLKSKKKSRSSMFGIYETGVRGTVFLLCTIPGCALISPIKLATTSDGSNDKESQNHSKESESHSTITSSDEDFPETKSKRKKHRNDGNDKISSEEKGEENKANSGKEQDKPSNGDDPPWEPVSLVRKIMSDLEQKRKTAPSSRFVSRMIPIQATCFASIEEIRLTCRELFKKYLPQTAKSFAVSAKRRNCSTMKTNQIIDAAAASVLELIPGCKVDLEDPDVTIVVEICKNLCGISAVPQCKKFRNFNLVAARERHE